MSVYQKVYDKLKTDGLNPYFQGKHKGLCTERYVVIVDGSSSSADGFFQKSKLDAYVYVPLNELQQLGSYRELILKSLKDVGEVKYTGNDGPTIEEESIEAYSKYVSFLCSNPIY